MGNNNWKLLKTQRKLQFCACQPKQFFFSVFFSSFVLGELDRSVRNDLKSLTESAKRSVHFIYFNTSLAVCVCASLKFLLFFVPSFVVVLSTALSISRFGFCFASDRFVHFVWIDCLVRMCMCASARSCLPLLLRFVSFWGFLAVNWFFFSCRRIILHHAEWLYTLFTTIDRNIVLDYMKSGFPRPFFFACFVIASLSGN